MIGWIRIDALIHDFPDLDDAAPFALDVFQAVLRVVKAHGSWKGTVQAARVKPKKLIQWLLWPPAMEPEVVAAYASLLKIGWLRESDATVIVPKWRRYQIDVTNGDRQSRHRGRRPDGEQPDREGGAEEPPETDRVAPEEPAEEAGDEADEAERAPRKTKPRSRASARTIPDHLVDIARKVRDAFRSGAGKREKGSATFLAEEQSLLAATLPGLVEGLDLADGEAVGGLCRRFRRVGQYLSERWSDDPKMRGNITLLHGLRHFAKYEDEAEDCLDLGEEMAEASLRRSRAEDRARYLCAHAPGSTGCVWETRRWCEEHGGDPGTCYDCRKMPDPTLCPTHATARAERGKRFHLALVERGLAEADAATTGVPVPPLAH